MNTINKSTLNVIKMSLLCTTALGTCGVAFAALLPQTISATVPAVMTYGVPVNVSATGGASGNPVEVIPLVQNGLDTCHIYNGQIIPVTAGTCVLHFSQLGNSIYADATPVQKSITINKATWPLKITSPAKTPLGSSFELTADGAYGPATIVFSIYPSPAYTNNCEVLVQPFNVGSTTLNRYILNTKHAGACLVLANQPGNANFNPSPQASQSITIDKIAPPIGFTNRPATLEYDSSIALLPTLTPMVFSTDTPDVCETLPGNKVHSKKLGVCTIFANYAGNTDYLPGETNFPITVIKSSRSVVVAPVPAITVNQTTILSITPTGSTGAINVTPVDASVCTADFTSKWVITGKKGGTCMLNIMQNGDANYNNSQVEHLGFQITKIASAITFTQAPSVNVGTTATLQANGGTFNNPVIFDSITKAICDVVKNPNTGIYSVVGLAAGSCTMTADLPETDYALAAAQQKQTILVGKGTQSPQATVAANMAYGTPIKISATGTPNGGTLTFKLITPLTCRVDTDPAPTASYASATITALLPGACSISTEQPETPNFSVGATTSNITITKGSQSIIFTQLPALTFGGSDLPIAATGGNSTSPVIIKSTTTGICTVINNVMVHPVSGGDCMIEANQAADSNYFDAPPKSAVLTIGKASQSISFVTLSSVGLNAGSIALHADATSGLPATFSSSTPAVCTLDGNTLSLRQTGICTVTANQAGNENYKPVSSTPANISVLTNSNTTVSSSANPVMVRKPLTLTATVNGTTPGGSMAFLADGTAISGCAAVPLVNGSATCSTSKLKAGTRSIVASYSGDANNQSSQSEGLQQVVRTIDWLVPMFNILLN